MSLFMVAASSAEFACHFADTNQYNLSVSTRSGVNGVYLCLGRPYLRLARQTKPNAISFLNQNRQKTPHLLASGNLEA